ncbi:MAG: peptidyl-prolyl cis-trans isomerase [Chthoniobacterales bacterium]|jgi:peptidyl-prolyl cis-trans isomerase SurA|nr:peptidyl-prolyl cis-trans isomerase [Chthoniobacterales bacterium]
MISIRFSPFFLSLAALALLASVATLPAAEEVINGIAAIVNGDVVTFSQVRELVASQEKSASEIYRGEELQSKVKVMREHAVRDLIDRNLILQEFRKKEFNIPSYIVDDSIQRIIRQEFGGDRAAFVKTLQSQGYTMARFRDNEKNKITVQAMRQSKTSENVIVSPVKIREYYEQHRVAYSTPAQVKLRMIVLKEGASSENGDASSSISKKQMAAEIREKLTGGAEFDRLAQMYSEDSTNESGGDWGWVERTTLNEELAKIVFSLKPSEISPVLPLDNAYYILMAEAVKPAVTKPLSEVQQEIVQKLIQEEKLKTQERWLKELREKAYIKIL